MFNPFKSIGDLKNARDQAMKIQNALAQEKVEVERSGVRVVMSGDQKIVDIETRGQSDNNIREAVNEAIKKSQEIAAKKFTEMSGGLGNLLGGMGGQ
ncbi:MAG: hypothetical protein UU37_C0006G0003 [Candidatus Gottesmanbacteria bacterium GW2011_GWA2_41_12]|uniref:Nucleoid-associated protein n=2 Tax=Candidatus Gottesmaniibacteriota TaxID=1752720 RepID=A0A0G0ULB9_9BACT|nr:MAG: hypothetical protein UT63_C0004G0007 [Candidatus Gottesmanbacteria bacterium GW2011_GWC2_39_8]KKR88316.1 MAG: hypothetical protein UU37_C0006G0003 [Candidatus Gottesmanbacteria bacterium GW2011_GWA2_41_12]